MDERTKVALHNNQMLKGRWLAENMFRGKTVFSDYHMCTGIQEQNRMRFTRTECVLEYVKKKNSI